MRLDHAWIARRVPHRGGMCLLDRVERWDLGRIRCTAISHRAADNPLRSGGGLAAVCGIEYAAQAMAVHGALLSVEGAQGARRGYLVSARQVNLCVARLDEVVPDLEITADRLFGGGNNMLYGFTVAAQGRVLLSGRATVVLDAAACPDVASFSG